MDSSTLRMKAESSTTSTRNFLTGAVTIIRLSNRHDRACRLRSHKLFDGGEKLVFLDRLGEESGSAFLHRAVSMLGAGARSYNHHRNSFGGWALAQLGHQLVAGHARHFEVGDDQVAAVLGNEFGGFQTVGGKFHAIAILFEHAANKFADADGIVGNDDDALLVDAIDGVAGNGAASDGGGTGREDAGSAGTGLDGAALVRLGRNHAVEIDEKDQAAIGRDGGAGEKLHPAEIFAEIFDDDFVFAKDLLDNDAHLAISGVGNNHAEVAIDGLKRRKAEIGIQANDFGDDVAHLGEKFSADVFDFIGAQAADFLDDGERQGEMVRTATHEERGRDDQGQGNFQT